jgi:hypothetical protein
LVVGGPPSLRAAEAASAVKRAGGGGRGAEESLVQTGHEEDRLATSRLLVRRPVYLVWRARDVVPCMPCVAQASLISRELSVAFA